MFSESAEPSGPSRIQAKRQLNESLYELYKPLEVPRMQILFFSGLQLGDQSDFDPYLWGSADGSIRSTFPCAQIFVVSGTRNMQEFSDFYMIGENILADLMQGNIGQVPDCPIILVGHSMGGLLIKQICLEAYQKFYLSKGGKRAKLWSFLDSVKGIFCYGTQTENPYSAIARNVFERTLSKDAARINSQFDKLRQIYSEWKICKVVVKEEHHPSTTKPLETTPRIFYTFTDFLRSIETDTKEAIRMREEGRPENLQYLPENIIGIDAQLQEVKAKLETSRTLGFVGMGGLGKTTLAKALFNELMPAFEYTCFLPEVKLIGGSVDDVKKEVWEHMHCRGKRVTEKEGWYRLGARKVLLVLDDVSDDRDVKVLMDISEISSCESRLIVTSRDQESIKGVIDIYRIPFLDLVNSRKLFKSHAFPTQEVTLPSELESLGEAIVRRCDGLPLTLTVSGIYLRRTENSDFWKAFLDFLERAESVDFLDYRLWEKLRPSFDGLNAETQQMFLDAATFFSGNEHWTLSDAMTAWKIMYSAPARLWQNLVDRSLVYNVKDDESIKVHKQFQSLAKRIASESNFRIWDEATMCKLLKQPDMLDKQGIHALFLGRTGDDHVEEIEINEVRIPNVALERLKNLRLSDVNIPIFIEGAQESELFPTKLALLHCDARSGLSQALLHPVLSNTLAVLRLSWHKDLCLPESIWCFSALKTLILSSATYLKSLPNQIGRLSQLEILELRECPCLGTLPETFGGLSNLSRLLVYDCENLHSLPESFGQLSALNYLDFKQCEKLDSLPNSFGDLSALSYLQFESCHSLRSLPKSFGHLSALSHLEFKECESFCPLPESFGHLCSLSQLIFRNCENLHSLPESFGHLSALSHLEFEKCHNLRSLPESFGLLSALSHLQFKECDSLRSLPDSFGHLSALSHLQFKECESFYLLPESFGHLSALSNLAFKGCESFYLLPESFGHLCSLSHLIFRNCGKLHSLPESFGFLSALSHLEFEKCHNLRSLPESFGHLSALSHLEFKECESFCPLPDSFGHLCSLSQLIFRNCENLHSLPESFGHLSALSHLEFEKCHNLRSLPESFRHLSALSHLQFKECESFYLLPESFGHLSALSNLAFKGCESFEDEFDGKDINTPQLEPQVVNSEVVHAKGTTLQSLKKSELIIDGEQSMEDFEDEFDGKDINTPQLEPQVVNSEVVHAKGTPLQSLKKSELIIDGAQSMEDFEDEFDGKDINTPQLEPQVVNSEVVHAKGTTLQSLKKSELIIDGEQSMEDFEDEFDGKDINTPQLEPQVVNSEVVHAKGTTLQSLKKSELIIDGAQSMEDFEDEFDGKDINTPQLEPQVVKSEMVHAKGTTLQSLKKSELIIDGAQSMEDFSASAFLYIPEDLIILNCPDLTKLGNNISQLQNVRYLRIQGCKSLTEIPEFLGELKGLEQLIIENCPYLVGIPETIGNLRSLWFLKIQDCAELTNLPKLLGKLRGLEQLIIWSCPSLVGIPDTIRDLGALQFLRIENCESLKDLPESVGRLQCLRQLIICNCPGLVEIPDTIGRFGALQNLVIRDCKDLVIDAETLDRIKAHEYVTILNCSNVGFQYLKLPNLSIVVEAPANQGSSKPNVDKLKSVFNAANEVEYEPEVSGKDGGSGLDLTRRAEEFKREVEEGGEDGYFVSSKGLLSLEESQRQSLKLSLWEAGYSEIYQTTTTTLFAKIRNEEENRITYYDASSTLEEKTYSLGGVDEVGASKRDGDTFKAALARISTTFLSIFFSFFLLFSGWISISSWNKRNRVRTQNQGGGGLGASSSRSSNESDVAGGNNDNTTHSLVSATTERGRNEGESFDCRRQLLRVACSPALSNEPPSSDPDEIVLKYYGDTSCVLEEVRMPDFGGRSTETISTCIERRFSIPAVEFSGDIKPMEVTRSMNATVTTRLRCCLSKNNDHQRPKVRINFSKISGKVESKDSNKQACNVVIVSCVGTTVYGCTRRTDNEREFHEIELDLDDEYRLPRGRVVEPVGEGQSKSNPDLVWLEISSSHAKNCKPGSVTVGLRGDVNGRLEKDLQTKVERVPTLAFDNGKNPVKFEGNIDEGNLLNSFLELWIRYKLEVCHYSPDITSAEVLYCPGRASPETIDFDCSLKFTSESLTH